MLRFIFAACCLALVNGWSVQPTSRRGLLFKAAVAAPLALVPNAANAVSARTGAASVFTGEYDDPNHPGCLRSVKVVGAKLGPDGRKERKPTAYVKGVDSLPAGYKGCRAGDKPTLADVWSIEGKVAEDGQSIAIDFSAKTNGKVGLLIGEYDDFNGPGIKFPDGNKWTKVAAGTPERRPPAVTLSND